MNLILRIQLCKFNFANLILQIGFCKFGGNQDWEAGGTRGGMPGEPAGAAGLTQHIKKKSKNPKSKA